MAAPRVVSIRPAVIADAQGVLDCLAVAFEPYRDDDTPDAYRATLLARDFFGMPLFEYVKRLRPA